MFSYIPHSTVCTNTQKLKNNKQIRMIYLLTATNRDGHHLISAHAEYITEHSMMFGPIWPYVPSDF